MIPWPTTVTTVVAAYRDPTPAEQRKRRSSAPIPLHKRLSFYVGPDGALFHRRKLDQLAAAAPPEADLEYVSGGEFGRSAVVVSWDTPQRRGRVRLLALDKETPR